MNIVPREETKQDGTEWTFRGRITSSTAGIVPIRDGKIQSRAGVSEIKSNYLRDDEVTLDDGVYSEENDSETIYAGHKEKGWRFI